MASEIEDCEGFEGFQTECMPTGSVSFGRFEAESLSWERRSSFLHNKYLEEVEKYSTPGSVTQKKAYFEAHFKKKGLLHQNSSVSQNGSEGHANEYNSEDHMNYGDGYEDHYNGIQFEEFHNNGDNGIQFSWYDETPDESDELEHNANDSEEVNSTPQFPMEERVYKEIKLETSLQQPNFAKTIEIETLSGPSSIKDDARSVDKKDDAWSMEEKDNAKTVDEKGDPQSVDKNDSRVDGEVDVQTIYEKQTTRGETTDASCEAKEIIATDPLTVSSKRSQKRSTKARTTLDPKFTKSKSLLTKGAPARQSVEKKHLTSVRASARVPKRIEKSDSPVAKLEKQIHSRTSPSTNLVKQATKDSGNCKSTERRDKMSVSGHKKDPKVTKSGIVSRGLSEKGERDKQMANRPRQMMNSGKPEPKTSDTIFSFKSDERAEKRKEYYMKLEQKHHVKEEKMNAMQTTTQRKTEAEMKQFRKSLNFKATPMPSFYHETTQRVSSGKQALAKCPGQQNIRKNISTKPAGEDASSDISSSLSQQITVESQPSERKGCEKMETVKKNDPSKKVSKVKSQDPHGASTVKGVSTLKGNTRKISRTRTVMAGLGDRNMAVQVAS